MALTYTYKVTSLKVRDEVNSDGVTLPNAVVQTYWKMTGTDENGNVGEFSGATPFTAANVPEGSFVPFDQLQEADVLSWIKAVVEGDAGYKAHIDERVQSQIDEKTIKEVQETSLPWAPADAQDVTPVPPTE